MNIISTYGNYATYKYANFAKAILIPQFYLVMTFIRSKKWPLNLTMEKTSRLLEIILLEIGFIIRYPIAWMCISDQKYARLCTQTEIFIEKYIFKQYIHECRQEVFTENSYPSEIGSPVEEKLRCLSWVTNDTYFSRSVQ